MLVVRVKRNRDDDPADTICLIEGNSENDDRSKKRKKLAFGDLSVKPGEGKKETTEIGSSSAANQTENRARLILKRVSTIDHLSRQQTDLQPALSSKKSLDEDTISLLRKRNEEDLDSDATETKGASTTTPNDEEPIVVRKRAKVIVTQNKKALPIAGAESCIVLDMMQVFQQPRSPQPPQKDESKPSPTKILDPATRLLRQGILTAINRNDFNDISSALIKGADANYRLDDKDGGYTALMAAAMKGNMRMVKRLLLNQVDAFATNKDGLTALDLVKKPTRSTQKECDEIKQELQQAMAKAHYQRKINMSSPAKTSSSQGGPIASESDYVYDVYCVDESHKIQKTSSVEETVTSEEGGIGVTPMNDTNDTIVKIDGLKILEDGQVELFEYDSDWSDLADDEDPDSNDERYYANDYPDEDSGDENGGRYFNNDDDASYSSEEEGGAYGKSRYRRSNLPEPRTAQYSKTASYSSRKVEAAKTDHISGDEEEDDGDDEEGVEEENALIEQQLEEIINKELGGGSRLGGKINIFDRNAAVGKVLRPHYIGESQRQNDTERLFDPPRHMDSESLREMWGEDVDDEDKTDQQQRVYDMRQRTNMLFASNPREFDSNGLPRFGAELSDDEPNYTYTEGAMMDEDEKPDRQAVAYDPDLDGESD